MNYTFRFTEKSLQETERNLQLDRYDCLLLGKLEAKSQKLNWVMK